MKRFPEQIRMFRVMVALVLAFAGAALCAQENFQLPMKEGSLRLAVIGDSGSGAQSQYEVARELIRYREKFPFEMVLMLGDNIYGRNNAGSFEKKFERPYKALLDGGVKFHAVLGNHDNVNQRYYQPFNMNGARFYTFRPKPGVRFFALDSNYMGREQLDWLEKELRASAGDWKICLMHHPLYSSGRHGSAKVLRGALEPLFVQYRVSVSFAGHEHFYERLNPQKGVHYFVSGAAGKLRRSDIRKTGLTAKGFDTDYSFMLIEIDGDDLYFQTISRTGATVDSGVIHRTAESADYALGPTRICTGREPAAAAGLSSGSGRRPWASGPAVSSWPAPR